MSFGEVFKKDRQVIPRWHIYPMARWLGVTASLKEPPLSNGEDKDYFERVQDWQEKGKISHAADLVGSALVLNNFDDPIAIEAAKFILKNRKKATESLIEISENFLRIVQKVPFPIPNIILPEELKKYYFGISTIKKRIREYPRNPILWMDLAFYYSALGQSKQAEDAVLVALSLNKQNRYIIRSGARFFIHNKTPDRALLLLRQSEVLLRDPWVLSAEIAISDSLNRTSKRMKLAKQMIDSKNFPSFHVSELASAIGTMEIKSGAIKKGKKLFTIALQDPTENVFAQAVFLKTLLGEPKVIPPPSNLEHSFEAQTRIEFQNGEFQNSLESAKKWFAYQPFSSRPASAASYVASVALGDFDEAARIARMGLMASPGEFLLKNNLAFSLASMGETNQSREILSTIEDSSVKETYKGVLSATLGVVSFREGKILEGRKLYEKAIESFKKQGDSRSEALAKFFWAREERIVKSPEGNKLMEEALKLARKLKIGELLFQNEKQI
ncbi:MAG: hypothetical protein KC643_24205 [Nitrospira sp.]|nr:hypothetical protein [Nitrospira sp.]